MGRQPFRATFAERTGSTLANGSVEAGARRVAGGAGFVRERLARPARAGTPVSDEPPTGSPVRGADASGRLGRRRQGDVRGCRTRFPTFDRQSPLSAPTRARSASPPRRTGSSRGERRSDVRQPVQHPARTGR